MSAVEEAWTGLGLSYTMLRKASRGRVLRFRPAAAAANPEILDSVVDRTKGHTQNYENN